MSLRAVTIRDIARKAGVSPMTVSRALRNANVSAETRDKVQRIANELGYRPNPLVSTLMTYRRAVKPVRLHLCLGYITNFPTRDGWKNLKMYQEFFQGAADEADKHGYRLEEFWLREPGMSSERLCEILSYRKIGGLLIAPLPVSHGHLNLLWDQFASVTFTYTLARPILHRMVNHQFRSMRTAIRHLRKLGYQRMGLAMPATLDQRVDNLWLGSFLVEQQRFKPRERVPLCLLSDKDWNEAHFAEWFKKNQPEVVISQQPKIIEWLQNLGKRVPQDVGFVHMNCPDCSGQFAGMYQNGPLIGRAAVDFLVGMLQRNERGIPTVPHTVLIDGTWVNGATVRKL
jgi:LacI family transcriptional regulator